MSHKHFFQEHGEETHMKDEFFFKAPLGTLGTIAEKLFLTGYMRYFLVIRNAEIKHLAESEEWQEYLKN